MQHVKLRWLKWISLSFALFDVALLLGYLFFSSGMGTEQQNAYWGITTAVAAFAGIHIAYVILIRPFIDKHSPWLASLISFVMTGLLVALLIETSGQENNLYRVALAVVVFLSAANGVFVTAATLALIWMLFIFTITALVQPSKTPNDIYLFIDLGHTLAGLLGWLSFRKFYLASNNEEVVALNSKLETEQFKSSAILESITDGVLVVNFKNIIQISNKSAAQMLGWSKDEVIDLDYHSLIKPISEKPNQETPETEAITEALKTGKAAQKISKLQTANGRQLYVDIVASPINQVVLRDDGTKEEKVTGIIAVLRDVDRQKRSEQQRSDFISTASHEMRTPVASIQGYLELALNPKISQVDEKTKTYLDKAYEATKHLGQLFQDLLTVSRTEDGRLSNHPTVVDVNKLLLSMYDEFTQAAAKKNLVFQCNLKPGQGGDRKIQPPMYVNADTERMREVIANLIENAIKYTPNGSITVNANVNEKDDKVTISVADTGIGIANEDIPHLFQKFYRIDNSATREIGGTGLGLYISKEIIELYDGRIWVESAFGKGSTFFIELPRVNPASAPAQTPPNPSNPPTQAV